MTRQPKPDMDAPLAIPEPLAADYSDELSDTQVAQLRKSYQQDESAMGPLVHEFTW